MLKPCAVCAARTQSATEVHLESKMNSLWPRVLLVLLGILASHALHKTRNPLGSGKTAEARTTCQWYDMPCCHVLS